MEDKLVRLNLFKVFLTFNTKNVGVGGEANRSIHLSTHNL